MHSYVVGNVAVDETIAVTAMPVTGASIFGTLQSRELGGKGANQAVVMARCGVATRLITAVGDGFRSKLIREQLAGEPVAAHLIALKEKSTDFSIILTVPDGENVIITTTDCAQSLTFDDIEASLADAKAGDLAIMQGNLSDETTKAVLAAARARGMVTAFNPSPLRLYFSHLWPLVDVAFLNEVEAQTLTGMSGEAAARQLLAAGVKDVVLTFGRNGAMLAGTTGFIHVPAVPCAAVDSTGAGDTFMAVALASAIKRSGQLDRLAIEHAARAAAITVSRPGTLSAFPTVEQLSMLLQER